MVCVRALHDKVAAFLQQLRLLREVSLPQVQDLERLLTRHLRLKAALIETKSRPRGRAPRVEGKQRLPRHQSAGGYAEANQCGCGLSHGGTIHGTGQWHWCGVTEAFRGVVGALHEARSASGSSGNAPWLQETRAVVWMYANLYRFRDEAGSLCAATVDV